VRWTTAADGDLRPLDGPGAGRLAAAAGRPVAWATQVHGTGVSEVDCGGPAGPADALVTTRAGLGLAVLTADCAPVALAVAGPGGGAVAVAAVHVGWRGLAAGVVAAAVHALESRGPGPVVAAVGPCIHRCCYAFGADHLGRLAPALGAEAVATTSDGGPALDLPAAAAGALRRAGAELAYVHGDCTACAAAPRYHSHRARRDAARQAMVVWLDG